MVGAIASLKDLLENVSDPKDDTVILSIFCGENSEDDENTGRRDILYTLTASLTRSFANCSDKLVSDYGYSEGQVSRLRSDISGYNKNKRNGKTSKL